MNRWFNCMQYMHKLDAEETNSKQLFSEYFLLCPAPQRNDLSIDSMIYWCEMIDRWIDG